MIAIDRKLSRVETELAKNPSCSDLWVTKARLLMLGDSGSLPQIEKCILKALDLSPDNLEAIEEAAHYYDVMAPNRRKAIRHAKRYLQLAERVVSDMRAILKDTD